LHGVVDGPRIHARDASAGTLPTTVITLNAGFGYRCLGFVPFVRGVDAEAGAQPLHLIAPALSDDAQGSVELLYAQVGVQARNAYSTHGLLLLMMISIVNSIIEILCEV
jgi:hypothetical protein